MVFSKFQPMRARCRKAMQPERRGLVPCRLQLLLHTLAPDFERNLDPAFLGSSSTRSSEPRDAVNSVLSLPDRSRGPGGGSGEYPRESKSSWYANLMCSIVSALTSGPMFARLSAEQQALASGKVQKMRPFFEQELEALRDERGWGATVTDVDIKQMLPRVIAREREAAAQQQA